MGWEKEVAQAKKSVQAAQRAAGDEHKGIYRKVVAEHEGYMERAVMYNSLRYILELAEAAQPQEIRAVRLQIGRVKQLRQQARSTGRHGGELFWATQPRAAGTW